MKTVFCRGFLTVLSCLAATGQVPTIATSYIGLEETTVFSPGVSEVRLAGSSLGACQESTVGTNECRVSVAVQGKAAQLIQVSPNSIRLRMPVDLAIGPANIVVTVEGAGSSPPYPVTIRQFSPVIWRNIFGQTFGTVGNAARGVDEANPAPELSVVQFPVYGLGAGSGRVVRILLARDGHAETELPIKEFIQGGSFGDGSSTIRFEVPCGFPAGVYQLAVEVSDPATRFVARSTARPLPVGGVGLIRVENAASYNSETVAPGAFLSVFGGGFGSGDAVNLFPRTEFEGLSILLNGAPARLFAVIASACQVNLVAPAGLTPGDRALTVVARKDGRVSNPVTVHVASSDPGLFRYTAPGGKTFAIATHANTAWLALPDSVSLAAGIPIDCEEKGVHPASSCGQPARAGDTLTLWLTGLGKATDDGTTSGNVLSDDEAAPANGRPLYRTVETPRVYFSNSVSGREGNVSFSGLSPGFFGLYQVNVTVPAGVPAGEAITVTVSTNGGVNGFPMSDQAFIAIAE